MPGARHGTAWPKVTRRVGGRGGTPARPRRQQRGRAALPSRCPRFAPALFPPPNFVPSPSLSPSSLPDVPVGRRWATDGCLCHGQLCLAGWKLLGQSWSCRIWGGQTPCPRVPKPRVPGSRGSRHVGVFPTSPAAAVPWRPEPWGAGGAHTCAGTLPLPASLDVPTFPRFSRRGAEGSVPPPRWRPRAFWQLTTPQDLGRAGQATSRGEAVPVVPPTRCPRWHRSRFLVPCFVSPCGDSGRGPQHWLHFVRGRRCWEIRETLLPKERGIWGVAWSPEVLLGLSASGVGDARGSLVLTGRGCWELGSSRGAFPKCLQPAGGFFLGSHRGLCCWRPT